MTPDEALLAAREWSLDDVDGNDVIDALATEVESLRVTLEQLRGWADNKQVWAVHGSYMDGYQAARRDVLRRLDSKRTAA